MQNFLIRLSRFMQGRYGTDDLNKALFILWLIINIINTVFIKSMWVSIFIALIAVLIIFRSLSRNIYSRQKENQNYLYYFSKVKPYLAKIKPLAKKVADWFKLQMRKFKDRKTHRYIKCPYCKAVIRVPFRKGKHTVLCPRCTVDFKTNIKF